MNKVLLTGRLTRDPEGRTTDSGVSMSRFTLAVRRRYRNAQGEYDADFLPIVAWRNDADFCNRYLVKGRLVAVEGTLQKRSYKAQDGTDRSVTEVIADSVEALDSAPRTQEGDGFTEVTDDAKLPWEA